MRGPGRARASQIWQTTVLPSVEWLRANTNQSWGFTNIAKVIVRGLSGWQSEVSGCTAIGKENDHTSGGKAAVLWSMTTDSVQISALTHHLGDYAQATSLCLAFPICEMGSSSSNHTCIPVLLGPLEWYLASNIDHKKCHFYPWLSFIPPNNVSLFHMSQRFPLCISSVFLILNRWICSPF